MSLRWPPAHTIATGYALLNGLGALGLWLAATKPISFLDALFTSTSALTVTGLAVQNTAETWTLPGHLLLLLLIQVGGLGWLTMALGTAVALGKRLGITELRLFTEERGGTMGSILRLSAVVFRTVAMVEGVGAVLLALFFWQAGLPPGQALWWGVFHSVSAFCNAGFDITGNSLVPFRDNWGIVLTVAGLILVGGLGFGVVGEVAGYRPRGGKLSTHARTVLATSALLVVAGTVLLYAVDRTGNLAALSEPQRWLTALFHSVSARTAGFNSVDMASWRDASLFLIIVLMFIGASPVSTGGGVKTTTVAVAFAAVRTFVRGMRDVRLGKNRVPDDLVRKSFVLLTGSAALLLASVFLLLAAEPDLPPMALIFEAVSAFATVGLSTGITPQLGVAGRLVILLLMVTGKLGVLAVLSISFQKTESRIQYPAADSLIVG